MSNNHIIDYSQINSDYSNMIHASNEEYCTVQEKSSKIKEILLCKPDITHRHNELSIAYKNISPGCIDCIIQNGLTMVCNFNCNMDCFHCFNSLTSENHLVYHDYNEQVLLASKHLNSFAISGGEPLLFSDEIFYFFKKARKIMGKNAELRLYTNGSLLNKNILEKFYNIGLNEIRISVKNFKINEEIFSLSKKYIPRVMVEIPVFPFKPEKYKKLLVKIDNMKIFGINLLEAVYPFRKSSIYRQKGYKLYPKNILWEEFFSKTDSYIQSLLNSGLPIFKSEETCLELLLFSLEKKLKLNVHYCSFKNKNLKKK